MQSLDATTINFLGFAAWQSLKKTALDTLRDGLPEPSLSDFIKREVNKYPPALMKIGTAAMILISLFAFIISAGKEWVIANRVFSSIPERYGIAPLWQIFALVAVLLLGEIGALSFALASSLFGSQKGIRILLRIASVTCAALALLGNLTLFFLDFDQHRGELLFDIVITVFSPLTVLAVGLVGERMLLEQLGTRQSAIAAYQAALEARENLIKNSLANTSYLAALQSLWAVTIVQYQPRENRPKVKLIMSLDFGLREQLFSHQFRMHEGKYPLLIEAGGATEIAPPSQPLL